MKQNIFIMPKHQFDGVLATNDTVKANFNDLAFISICEPGSDRSCDKSHFDSDTDNVLRVYVHDIEEPVRLFASVAGQFGTNMVYPMSERQAQTIVDFVDRNLDKKGWILHCTMGISRSGAVGAYIAERLGIPFETIKRWNPRIIPNAYILNKLRTAKGWTAVSELK